MRDDDYVCFALDQCTVLDFHSTNSQYAGKHSTKLGRRYSVSGMSLEAGNRRKSPVISAVAAGNFLIGKIVK